MRRISIDALTSSREEVLRFRDLLDRGGIAAVPTETYYALAADPWSPSGTERIFSVKARRDDKPLLLLFSRREHLERLRIAASPDIVQKYFRIWPAPLTVVFPIREPLAASRGGSSIAVRLPAEPRLRALLDAVGPLTGTSLNHSASPPLDDPDTIDSLFADEVDLLVDGGRTPGGRPSTILDATRDPPAVLRAGAFQWTAQ